MSDKSSRHLPRQVGTLLPTLTGIHADLANNDTLGYGSNWMQLSLDDDSDEEGTPDPHKELNEYLDSKREVRKEGLVEWWGVSILLILLSCPTNRLHVSIILLAILHSPASRVTISRFKDRLSPQSALFRAGGSPELTYAIDSRPTHSRHFRSSRAPFATGFSTPPMKQQLMWQLSGTMVDLLMQKIPQSLSRHHNCLSVAGCFSWRVVHFFRTCNRSSNVI
jgi:hypothetical protein